MLTRRVTTVVSVAALISLAAGGPSLSQSSRSTEAVATGADVLAASGFAELTGKRVGLITNQTGRVGDAHLADLIGKATNVKLTAILAPEHGFRGKVEAGKRVSDAVDAETGAPVFSLY